MAKTKHTDLVTYNGLLAIRSIVKDFVKYTPKAAKERIHAECMEKLHSKTPKLSFKVWEKQEFPAYVLNRLIKTKYSEFLKDLPFEDIAFVLGGVTKQRVQQLDDQAKRKLQNISLNDKKVKKALDELKVLILPEHIDVEGVNDYA